MAAAARGARPFDEVPAAPVAGADAHLEQMDAPVPVAKLAAFAGLDHESSVQVFGPVVRRLGESQPHLHRAMPRRRQHDGAITMVVVAIAIALGLLNVLVASPVEQAILFVLLERFAAESRSAAEDGRITVLVSHRFSPPSGWPT